MFAVTLELILHSEDELRYDGAKNYMHWLDDPEARLVTILVFATKLLHPMDNLPRFAKGPGDHTLFRIDWEKWRELHSKPREVGEGLERRDLYKIRPEDVGEMTERQLDDYLAWYQQSEIKKEGGELEPDPFSCFLVLTC